MDYKTWFRKVALILDREVGVAADNVIDNTLAWEIIYENGDSPEHAARVALTLAGYNVNWGGAED